MAYSNIALSPDGGGTWSLSRSVPRQLATELLMLGERMPAERLHQLGVVNRLCEPGQALGTALTLASLLNQKAHNALTSIKELINEADAASFHHQLALERDHFVKNLHHVKCRHWYHSLFKQRKTSLRIRQGPSGDNFFQPSHSKDRLWTNPFLRWRKENPSTLGVGSLPFHLHSGTTYFDALTSNGTKTANSLQPAENRRSNGSPVPKGRCVSAPPPYRAS
jgi:hypothetical protein